MSQISLKGIKTNIKSILTSANSATASPIDLSKNMTDRVKGILDINIGLLPIQPSIYPCITTWIESKNIEHKDIAKNQTFSKRMSDISIKIGGVVWKTNQNDGAYSTDIASDECEYLMENIEEIIRDNQNLGNTVNWTMIRDVQYYSTYQEDAHLRVGIITMDARVYY